MVSTTAARDGLRAKAAAVLNPPQRETRGALRSETPHARGRVNESIIIILVVHVVQPEDRQVVRQRVLQRPLPHTSVIKRGRQLFNTSVPS